MLTNHSHFSLQVTSNSITKFMPNNFHPQDLSHILQAIPTYTTSERISTSITLPTTFQQHILIGLENIPSTECERCTIHATEIKKRRRDRWTESKVQQNDKRKKKMLNRREKDKQKVIMNVKATHMLPNLSKNESMHFLSSTHVLLVWNHILVSLLIHLLMDQFVIDATEKPMVIFFLNGIIWTLAPNISYSPHLLKSNKFSLLISSQF